LKASTENRIANEREIIEFLMQTRMEIKMKLKLFSLSLSLSSRNFNSIQTPLCELLFKTEHYTFQHAQCIALSHSLSMKFMQMQQCECILKHSRSLSI
jgi:hypothetical protein